MSRIDYLNVGPDQQPGLIVQTITDGVCAGADLDPNYDGVVVALNAAPTEQTFELPTAGLELHPVQVASSDSVTQGAEVEGRQISVPGMTAAVFVLPQGAAQGAGLPCNAR